MYTAPWSDAKNMRATEDGAEDKWNDDKACTDAILKSELCSKKAVRWHEGREATRKETRLDAVWHRPKGLKDEKIATYHVAVDLCADIWRDEPNDLNSKITIQVRAIWDDARKEFGLTERTNDIVAWK